MLNNILKQFDLQGDFIKTAPYGEGHINDTFVTTLVNKGFEKRYLLQKINNNIFPNIELLMNNINYVTSFLREQIIKDGGDPTRETLTLIKTRDGLNYYHDKVNNGYYRLYLFIEDTVTHQTVLNNEIFYECGKSFGKFQNLLAKADSTKIFDVIPNFHNTYNRYLNLLKTIEENKVNRVNDVQEEINFFKQRENEYNIIYSLLESNEIPFRITHNDTKLNNILVDPVTNKGICIIDLDTIMRGSVLFDIGDSLRFGCNTSFEDEIDLNKVNFDIEKFDCYIKGFIEETKNNFVEKEIEHIAFSAKLLTMECGMRFLTDHIDGDNFFKIHRINHNLDRARTQIKLVKDIERQFDEMQKIVRKYIGDSNVNNK